MVTHEMAIFLATWKLGILAGGKLVVCAGMHGYLGLGIVGLWWYLLVVRRTGSGSGNPGEPHNHRADMVGLVKY